MTVPSYATVDQFKSYIGDNSQNDPDVMATCLAAASRQVEGICGRHFYQTTEVQYFSPDPNNLWLLYLDDMDLATKTGLTVNVEFGNDGTYPTTYTVDVDFICEPINQSMNGIDGWPYTMLRAVNGKIWPQRFLDFYRDTVKITATWGWSAIPDAVTQATLVLAADLYKGKDAPFGVAGFGAFGSIRVRDNPVASILLKPYRKGNTLLMA